MCPHCLFKEPYVFCLNAWSHPKIKPQTCLSSPVIMPLVVFLNSRQLIYGTKHAHTLKIQKKKSMHLCLVSMLFINCIINSSIVSWSFYSTPSLCALLYVPFISSGSSAEVHGAISASSSVKMSRGKHIRVLVLNDMEKLDRTLFRLEQGKAGLLLFFSCLYGCAVTPNHCSSI